MTLDTSVIVSVREIGGAGDGGFWEQESWVEEEEDLAAADLASK